MLKNFYLIRNRIIFAKVIQNRNKMKRVIISLSFLIFVLTFIISCKTSEKQTKVTEYKDSVTISTNEISDDIIINITKGGSFNYPTFVIWQEDLEGNFVKTLYITKSYASGVFGREMIGDTMWMNKPGKSYQPAALPYWTYKKGLINNKTYVPTPENPYIDAYTGATPTTNFSFDTKIKISKNQKYKILVEVNQTWDWNNFWTNNKYPENNAYKHSAQPSLIYAVNIDNENNTFYLNPIGHGCPTGENGKLYTDLSTFTTALDIFKEIKITVKN